VDIDKLPKQASWMSKDVARELKTIEATAQRHIKLKARFAMDQGLVALVLKDEHCIVSEEDTGVLELNLNHCWYRTKEKFHKGDRILLVKSSSATSGTILQLSKHADDFDWHHPHLPSNLHWYCKIVSEIATPR
jgi:hypothetical protein